MKLILLTGIISIISSTASALPIPNPGPDPAPAPVNWLIGTLIPIQDCANRCCGFGCFPGMFDGFRV